MPEKRGKKIMNLLHINFRSFSILTFYVPTMPFSVISNIISFFFFWQMGSPMSHDNNDSFRQPTIIRYGIVQYSVYTIRVCKIHPRYIQCVQCVQYRIYFNLSVAAGVGGKINGILTLCFHTFSVCSGLRAAIKTIQGCIRQKKKTLCYFLFHKFSCIVK